MRIASTGAVISIAVLSAIVFHDVVGHDFLYWDDYSYILDNFHVKNGLSPESVSWAFTQFHSGNWHPLTWISHMLDCEVFGLNPAGHHLINVVFHTLNGILLFVLLHTMTAHVWRSCLVALLFIAHPLHVESVAWVSERKDLLCAMFWMLTLLAYVGYTRQPTFRRYLLTMVLLACGLMSKPMMVMAPVTMMLLDFWPLGRLPHQQLSTKRRKAPPSAHAAVSRRTAALRLVSEKIPFFMLSAVAAILTILAQRAGMADIEKLPVIYRTANALIAYFLYLAKTLYPLDLAAFYPLYRSASEWRWTLIWALPALLLLLSISGWCIRSRDKRPYLGVGWFWYVGTLLPVIGLVQVGRQSMADRYTYIPLIGIFVMLTWGAAALLKTRHQRPLAPALLSGFCLLMLSFLSVRQVATWKNTLTVFSHADAVTGNNYLAKSKVAREHFEAGNYQKALELLKKAIEINPSSAEAYSRAGKVYDALGQPEQAIAYFTKALELNPRSPETHTNLGIVLARRANLKAERHLRDALELDPEYAMGHLNMGVFLSQTGRVEPAVSHLLQAIRLKNDFADAHFNLGVLYEMQNKPEDAVRHYTLALKFKPSYAGEPYRLRDYIRAMHETAHPNAGGQ